MRNFLALVVVLVVASAAYAADGYPLSSVRYEGALNGTLAVLSDGSEFLALTQGKAVRLSATGDPREPIARTSPIDASSAIPVGIWTGDSYLVASMAYGGPDGQYTIVTRRDRDGIPVDDIVTRLTPWTPLRFVRSGPNYLLISASSQLSLDVLEGSGRAIRQDVDFPGSGYTQNVAAATIDAGALILDSELEGRVFRLRARVVNERGEVVRDYVIDPYANAEGIFTFSTPSGAVAIWTTKTDITTATFDATGTLLNKTTIHTEPDGIRVTGAGLVEEGILLTGFDDRTQSITGTLLISLDGKIVRHWVQTPRYVHRLATNGHSALVFTMSGRGWASHVLSSDGVISDPREFPPAPSMQTTPAIACSIEDCLVVWSESTREGYDSIRGTILGPDGKPSSPDSFEISSGPGYYPAVARSRDQYLVVWQTSEYEYSAVTAFGRRVSPVGELLDPVPFTVDSEEYEIPSMLPSVASDGRDFLVARTHFHSAVAIPVSASAEVGEVRTLTDPKIWMYGAVSLTWTGSNYLAAYGDDAPCQITCPVWKKSVWVRPLSARGDPIGPQLTAARGEGVAFGRIGSTTNMSLVTWIDGRDFMAMPLETDGSPAKPPFKLQFGGWQTGTFIPTDDVRFYFTGDRGFATLNEKGIESVAMPLQRSTLAAIGIEGNGRPRMIVSDGEAQGVPRLYVYPFELWRSDVALRTTVVGLPSEAEERTETDVVVTFSNDGDRMATNVSATMTTGVPAATDSENCTSDGYQMISCRWSTLAPHEAKRATVHLRFGDYDSRWSEFEFRSWITAAEVDHDASDNAASVTYRIVPQPRKRPIAR